MSKCIRMPIKNISYSVNKNDIILVFALNKRKPWVCKKVTISNDFALLELCDKEDLNNAKNCIK